MKKLLTLAFVAILSLPASATTTVTISNTPVTAGATVDRFGLTLGAPGYYSITQLLKSLEYAVGAYPVPAYANTIFYCDTSQAQTATTFFSQEGNSSVYWPANFWQGASYSYYAYSGSAYASPITGTVSSSTNNSAADIQLVLGTSLGTACSNASSYLLINQINSQTLAASTFGFMSSGVTVTSDAPTGALQSIDIPPGGTWTNYIDTGSGGPSININGSYTAPVSAKCASTGTCSISRTIQRGGGNTFVSSSHNLTTSWQAFSDPVSSATETYANTARTIIADTVTCTSSSTVDCRVTGKDFIEGSTLAGNTTPFRDSVVRQLEAMHLGVIRYMWTGDWATDVSDAIVPDSQQRIAAGGYSGSSNYGLTFGITFSYRDDLALSLAVGADAWITLGNLNSATQMTTLVSFLTESCTLSGCPGTSSQSWSSMYKAAGLKFHLELGNEQWGGGNSAVQQSGNGGLQYGGYLHSVIPALRTATGWDPSVMEIISDGWFGNAGQYGFDAESLIAAGCTSLSSTPNYCPDRIDMASYMLDTIANTTDIYHDGVAEAANYGSVYNGDTGVLPITIPNICGYMKNTFGVGCAIYEEQIYPGTGGSITTSVTAAQVSANIDSYGASSNNFQQYFDALRDAKMTGPINMFAYENYGGTVSGNTGGSGPVGFLASNAIQYAACGPGQLTSCTDVLSANGVMMATVNTAIGSNNVPLQVTLSGQPTVNYAGGQGGTIAANASVNQVDCWALGNGTSSYTVACKNSTTTAQPISFTGAGAPLSSTPVALTVTNSAITDSNDSSVPSNNATAPVMVEPTPAAPATGLNSYSIPAGAMAFFNYTLASGTATVATPVFSPKPGAYPTGPSVTITTATAGATIYYTTNGAVPTTASTIYTGPIAVTATTTIRAIAVKSGYTTSPMQQSVYTVSGVPCSIFAGPLGLSGPMTVSCNQ